MTFPIQGTLSTSSIHILHVVYILSAAQPYIKIRKDPTHIKRLQYCYPSGGRAVHNSSRNYLHRIKGQKTQNIFR